MFQSARIKLTVVYTILILIITGTTSALFYQRTNAVLEFEYNRIQTRMEFELNGQLPPMPGRMHRAFNVEDLEIAKSRIFWQLIRINGLIVIVFGIAGYWLSGFTLRPIQIAMDEQSRFIGDAAHELKTPITGLKTSLEVNLMDDQLPKEAKKILEENLADVTSLQSLSENLLALAKNSGKQISLKPTALLPNVEQAIRHLKPLALKKKISIETIGVSHQIKVNANEALLLDLLLILIDNAIKYSNIKSTVTITVTNDKKYVSINVIDKGIGISSEDIDHIFDRFYRADKSRTKSETKGYGLGLSVARKIVEQMHGIITVNSELGKGSVFSVRLGSSS